MPEERFVFPQMIEGLFVKGLKGQVTPALQDKLSRVGIDLRKKLLPAYPADTWYSSLGIAAKELFPSASTDEGYLSLGHIHVEGYTGTLIGRVLQSTFAIVGPLKVLRRAEKNFRSGDNYTKTQLTEIGPGQVDLWINEVGPNPNYMKGVLEAGLQYSGAKQLAISVTNYDGHAATFQVRWAEGGVPPTTKS